jgi:hypothetical protein
MTVRDKIVEYLHRDENKRVAGRYWQSDLSSIFGGYMKPKDFFSKGEDIVDNAEIVCEGMAKENMLAAVFQKTGVDCYCGEEKLYGEKAQKKYILDIADGVTLVVKPDFEFPTKVWETKNPLNWDDYTTIKPSYKYQCEAEYRATGKQAFLGYFVPKRIVPILVGYTPDDKLWEEIKKKLINFDKKVRELCQQ